MTVKQNSQILQAVNRTTYRKRAIDDMYLSMDIRKQYFNIPMKIGRP